MKQPNNERNHMHGRLPASAPLANPYVPFQYENPPMFDARKALVRGTLYPGLELPFMGKVNGQNQPVTPMTELQTLAFAIQELALYLDTHREDREAQELYQSYQEMYHKCMMEYQKNRGPLNHRIPSDGPCYRWLDDPWPWEYCKNKEG